MVLGRCHRDAITNSFVSLTNANILITQVPTVYHIPVPNSCTLCQAEMSYDLQRICLQAKLLNVGSTDMINLQMPAPLAGISDS